MRGILFRGRRLPDYEWVEGYYCKYGHTGAEKNYIIPVYASVLYAFDVIPETVGQYTGLTDNNGKKIFEGDIIKSTVYIKQVNGKTEREIISVVEYGIGYAYSNVYGVCQRFRDGSGSALLSVMSTSNTVDCTIIGNIHDNPEILRGEIE